MTGQEAAAQHPARRDDAADQGEFVMMAVWRVGPQSGSGVVSQLGVTVWSVCHARRTKAEPSNAKKTEQLQLFLPKVTAIRGDVTRGAMGV